MQHQPRILTPELVKRTIPFEFPNELPIQADQMLAIAPHPYEKYGTKGSAAFFLDYSYGSRPFLPLAYDRVHNCLPSGTSVEEVLSSKTTVIPENLFIIDTQRHHRFIAAHLYPEDLAPIELQLPASHGYQAPKPSSSLEKRIKKGMNTAWTFWWKVVELENKAKGRDPDAIGAFHAVHLSMYMDKIRYAIEEDIAGDTELFSLASSSNKMLRLGETCLLGLPQK
jgi:hypothetical protein